LQRWGSEIHEVRRHGGVLLSLLRIPAGRPEVDTPKHPPPRADRLRNLPHFLYNRPRRDVRGGPMPAHDWTRVDAGIFHAFHLAWLGQLQAALNGGLLPAGYYAMAEQHAGAAIPDFLTLHTSPPGSLPRHPRGGGVATVTKTKPGVQRKLVARAAPRARRRTLAVRHVSGHRIVALLEIVSPANKDRRRSVKEFVNKVVAAIQFRIHVSVVDLFPPGPHDPAGMHGAIWDRFDPDHPYNLPPQLLNNSGKVEFPTKSGQGVNGFSVRTPPGTHTPARSAAAGCCRRPRCTRRSPPGPLPAWRSRRRGPVPSSERQRSSP
jgi:hypothetical protein